MGGPQAAQRARRGRNATVVVMPRIWSSGVAPRAHRATAAAGDNAGGQVGLDPVGHRDADHDRWSG